MGNQDNQVSNQENSAPLKKAFGRDQSFDQADGRGGAQEQQKLSEGVPSDDDENAGELHRTKLMNRAEAQVRENEEASLQDDTYTFDSDNTYSDEGIDDFDVEDVGGGMSEFDVDNNDDFV